MAGKGRILNYIKWLIKTIDDTKRVGKEDKERTGGNKQKIVTNMIDTNLTIWVITWMWLA